MTRRALVLLRRAWLWPVAAAMMLAFPAVTPASTVSKVGGEITVHAGLGERDGFGIGTSSGVYVFANSNPQFARMFAASGCSQGMPPLGDRVDCPSAGVSKIELTLLDRDDETGGGGFAAALIVHGGPGADRLHASGNATLEGGEGPDELTSFLGPNVLDGGSGADSFISQVDATSSIKRGGTGDDRFVNLRGVEDVSGGPGLDTVEVGGGDDAILSLDDQPNDSVGATDGSNIRADVERVIGGSGDDILSTLSGPQTLQGGGGGDSLDGGAGSDTLRGDTGDDTIFSRDGTRDQVDCGPGVDRAVAEGLDAVANCEAVLLDEDHDGASTDTDCNDADSGIRPGAVDIPDNGVDENCDGSQLNDPDRDRDGVQRPGDCRDDRSDIHPGAIDVPRNGIDEDCTGGDADYPRIASTIRATLRGVSGGYTRFTSLKILNARAGSTVRLRCSGPGCRLRAGARIIRVKRNRASLNLTRRVRRVRLRQRTQVEVRVTQAGTIGALTRWRGRKPRITECSLPPGARRPQQCHKP